MLYINSACRRRSWGDHAGGGKFYTYEGAVCLTTKRGESHYPAGRIGRLIIMILILTNRLVKLLSFIFFSLAKLAMTSDCAFLLLSDFLPHLGAQ